MKEPTAHEREMMHRILDICIDYSVGDGDMFFNISPHVASIDVEIYRNGWRPRSQSDYWGTGYLEQNGNSKKFGVEKLLKHLEEEKEKQDGNVI